MACRVTGRAARILVMNLLLASLLIVVSGAASPAAGGLPGMPDLGADLIVFTHGGDLWSVRREGGLARRLTSHPGRELHARISPDGTRLAFTAAYDGSAQVYTMPIDGGVPRQLTFVPDPAGASSAEGGDNIVIDWTPDGKQILFLSRRASASEAVLDLWVVAAGGGMPRPFAITRAGFVSWSPDGRRIACTDSFTPLQHWRGYRGGLAPDIWLLDLETDARERLTDFAGTDTWPIWIDDVIYFVSDRGAENRLNLHALDPATHAVRQITHFEDFDVRWPGAGPGGIVFEKGGVLYLMEWPAESIRPLSIRVPDERLEMRKRRVDVSGQMTAFDLSPAAANVVLTARGDLFVVPVSGEAAVNLTRSSGVREKDAAISPDGARVAYVTDRYRKNGIGEDEIALRAIDGSGVERRVTHDGSGARATPLWSPLGESILFAQAPDALAWVDLETGRTQRIDRSPFGPITDYDFSPDGLWVAYAKPLGNHVSSIFLYSIEDETITAVTGPGTDDREPVFDPKGRYLYFLTACPTNPIIDSLDDAFAFPEMIRPVLVSLRDDVAPPGAPGPPIRPDLEDDDLDYDGGEEEWVPDWPAGPLIERDGLSERLVVLPVEAAPIEGLDASAESIFFLVGSSAEGTGSAEDGGGTLRRFDIADGLDLDVARGVQDFVVADSGALLLWTIEGGLRLVDELSGVGLDEQTAGAAALALAGEENAAPGIEVDLSGLVMRVDPPAEWRQIFAEAWRMQRDHFVDRETLDKEWTAARERFEPLLDRVTTRADLDALIGAMLSELRSSHIEIWSGDDPRADVATGSMPGCDLTADEATGLYRISRILRGDPRDALARGPLAAPGLGIRQGDLLLAIDGIELRVPANPFELFNQGLSVQPGTLSIGPAPLRLTVARRAAGPERDLWIRPTDSELPLRAFAERERRRRRVEQASGGRIGYLWLTDMERVGLDEFARWFYPQIRKAGLIIDLRDNGGGYIDRMILDRLGHARAGTSRGRHTPAEPIPEMVFEGPMVCLVNANSASDAEYFAAFFREAGLGPVIGQRTWGGARALQDEFTFVDGGGMTVPQYEAYDLEGHRLIENRGVEPDIAVDLGPVERGAAGDPALEKALEWLAARLATPAENGGTARDGRPRR